MSTRHTALASAATLVAVVGGAAQGEIVHYTNGAGLSAEAEFSLADNGHALQVRLRNTTTATPEYRQDGGVFTSVDQLVTAISFDLGFAGPHFADPLITGGLVSLGATSSTVNFDTGVYGPGTNVSGEYGFSNSAFPGLMQNFITAEVMNGDPFGGPNLNGPEDLDDGEAGLFSADSGLALDAQIGAIETEIVALLYLSYKIDDLGFLAEHGSRIEFGDNAFFLAGVPAPGVLSLLGLAAVGRRTSRRRRHTTRRS